MGQYILDEQLNDPELPVEDELGDGCDPTDCAYSWMSSNSDSQFPSPHNVQIPDEKKEEYIFYILRYIYKHNKAPSTKYIKDHILSKVNGITRDEKVSSTNNNDEDSKIPSIKDQAAKPTFSSFRNEENNEEKKNDGIICIKRISKTQFKPKYAARAHLN